jgi:hypothetical protein
VACAHNHSSIVPASGSVTRPAHPAKRPSLAGDEGSVAGRKEGRRASPRAETVVPFFSPPRPLFTFLRWAGLLPPSASPYMATTAQCKSGLAAQQQHAAVPWGQSLCSAQISNRARFATVAAKLKRDRRPRPSDEDDVKCVSQLIG